MYIVYCFFVLVVMASYTANFTTYLSITNTYPELTSLSELVSRGATMGINPGGSTAAYFTSGEDALAQKAAKRLVYCATEECLDQLRGGSIDAFISDKPLLVYYANLQACDLLVAGRDFGPGGVQG